jgi:hypothetical protein
MTAPVTVPTLAALQRKARALYREAEKRDREFKARGGFCLPSFAIMRVRRLVAAVRPAVEYGLLRNRKPSLAVIAGAVRYIAGRRLPMGELRSLASQMYYRTAREHDRILVDDNVERWTASVIETACVIVASTAKPRDTTDALTRMSFVLRYAGRLPERYRAATLRRITADTRALLWCDVKALPHRDERAAKRQNDQERRASRRAGRSFLS